MPKVGAVVEDEAAAAAGVITDKNTKPKDRLMPTKIINTGTNDLIISTNKRATAITEEHKMGEWTNLVNSWPSISQ